MKIPPKIALIGDGPTADAHALALKAHGITVTHCSAGVNTQSLNSFAKKHNIRNVWASSVDLIRSHTNWDGIIIAASIPILPTLLEYALESEKPILIEKPVSSGIDYLKKFEKVSPSNVMVGYNRRFYATVDRAIHFLNNTSKSSFCFMQLPEKIDLNAKKNIAHLPIYNNSCHGVDLLLYLFGELEIRNVEKLINNGIEYGRYVTLRSKRSDTCFLSLNWNSPSNFSMYIESEDEKIKLEPLESFQRFKGMSIVEPTTTYPLRQYLPLEIEKSNVFIKDHQKIKPGFLDQSLEFLELISGNPPKRAARLSDAYRTQLLVKTILDIGS